jgi:hypothetical protein
LLALPLAAMALEVPAQVTVPGGTVVETGPGWGIATTTRMASARVAAIDVPTRRLDLLLADGSLVGLLAGPEVRRLEQIRVGDVIDVSYTEALMLSLRKHAAGNVARTESSDVRRGAPGAPPSGVKQSETTVLADVVAVDTTGGTLTLRGPQKTLTLRIKDPQQLALVQVGDQVEATYSEAVAVSIDPIR